MAIVGSLDIHRRQITYDWIDTTTGESCRGQLSPATRVELRAWLARFTGQQAHWHCCLCKGAGLGAAGL